jgi:hypothetical protein
VVAEREGLDAEGVEELGADLHVVLCVDDVPHGAAELVARVQKERVAAVAMRA